MFSIAKQYTNVGGIIYQIKKKYTNVNNTIYQIKKEYTNVNGVIEQIFGACGTNYFKSNATTVTVTKNTAKTITVTNTLNKAFDYSTEDISASAYAYGYLILKITNASAGGDSSTIQRYSSQSSNLDNFYTNAVGSGSTITAAMENLNSNNKVEVPDTVNKTLYYAFGCYADPGSVSVDGKTISSFKFTYNGESATNSTGTFSVQVLGLFIASSLPNAKEYAINTL